MQKDEKQRKTDVGIRKKENNKSEKRKKRTGDGRENGVQE